MAQGDIFSNIFNGKLNKLMVDANLTLEDTRSIQAELLAQQMNMYTTRKDMLKSDKATLNLYNKLKDVGSKIVDQTKIIHKTKKLINNTEKEINNIEKEVLKLRKSTNQEDKDRADLLDGIIKKTKVNNEMNKISLKIARQTIPVLGHLSSLQGKTFKNGKGGGLFNAIANTSNALIGLLSSFTNILPIIGEIGGFLLKIGKTVINLILAPVKKLFSTFLEIQSTVGNLAADIGLTHQESHGLLQNMTGLALEASKYGGSMKDVAAIFQEFSSTTGKNRFFSKEEVGALTELGLGTGLGVQGATQLAAAFDNIGISLDKTVKLTDKARNMAARYNVNSTTLLKTYNQLVTNLTGIGFGKGLDNLTKLAARAQAMRFDIVASTKAFTDVFFEPDIAAQAAAQMQVLGGAFAQSFGDPMQLAFESMNDPTKLAEKFAGLVQGMVTKTTSGDFIIPPAARKQLRLASEALGQDYENIKNTAIEQAKIVDKMSALGKQGIFNINDDDKPALASLMKLNNKNKYEIQMSDGTTKLLENITDKRQLDAILDARQKNEKAAIERKNVAERLSLIADRFMLGFSTVMTKLFGGTDFDNFLGMVEQTGTKLAEFIQKDIMGNDGLAANFKNILDKGKDVFDKIVKIFESKDGIGKKIGASIATLFTEIAVPLITEIVKLVAPFLKAGWGALLSSLGGLPIIGKGLKQTGDLLQKEAIASDKSGLLSGIYGTQNSVQGAMGMDENHGVGEGLLKGGKSAKMGYELAKVGGSKVAGAALLKGGGVLGKFGMKRAGAKLMGKSLAKHIPVIGSLISAGFAINDLIDGDYAGAGLQTASALANLIPGIGTLVSVGLDGVDAAREMGTFDDGVIYKDGSYGKFGKGDMVQFIDQAAYERANTGTNATTSGKIEHSGTIRIESPDGKMVTWEQMYNARDMVGSSIQSLQQTYNGGFGDYQNTNTMPIKPLI